MSWMLGVPADGGFFVGVTWALPKNEGSLIGLGSFLLTVMEQLLSGSITVVALATDFLRYEIPRRMRPRTRATVNEVTREQPRSARNVPRHNVKSAVDVCFCVNILLKCIIL